MMAGPRTTDRSITAPASIDHLALDARLGVDGAVHAPLEASRGSAGSPRACPRACRCLSTSRRRCAAAPSSPRSIRSWMASVISSSLRKLGLMRFTDSNTSGPTCRRRRAQGRSSVPSVSPPGGRPFRRPARRPRTSADPAPASSRICAAGALAHELLDELGDAFVEQVVAEVHHERFVSDERLADEDGVRESSRRILLDVGDRARPRRSVTHRRTDLRLRVADDDADVADACGDDGLDAIEQHGLVGDRHELLRARVGQGRRRVPLPPLRMRPFIVVVSSNDLSSGCRRVESCRPSSRRG